MSKRRLYFHITLIVIILGIGGYSIWEKGLIPDGTNHPNVVAFAMLLLLIGQIAALKAYQIQKRKNTEVGN